MADSLERATNKHAGMRLDHYKSITLRSKLSPELKRFANGAKALGRPPSVRVQIEAMLRGAGSKGIDIRIVAREVFKDRKPVADPMGSTYTCISAMRRMGVPVVNTGYIFSIGNHVVTKVPPSTDARRSADKPLSDRELEVLRILRQFSNVWLTANDIASEMKLSRTGDVVDVQRVSCLIRALVTKGFSVDRRGANNGTALLCYMLNQKNVEVEEKLARPIMPVVLKAPDRIVLTDMEKAIIAAWHGFDEDTMPKSEVGWTRYATAEMKAVCARVTSAVRDHDHADDDVIDIPIFSLARR